VKVNACLDTQNLIDLSAICLHLSVWAATVGSQGQASRSTNLSTVIV